jgi:hypothetical protein
MRLATPADLSADFQQTENLSPEVFGGEEIM